MPPDLHDPHRTPLGALEEALERDLDLHTYGPHSIRVLSPTEALRRRPGMYLGDPGAATTATGLLDNTIQVLLFTAARQDPLATRRELLRLETPVEIVVETERTVRITHPLLRTVGQARGTTLDTARAMSEAVAPHLGADLSDRPLLPVMSYTHNLTFESVYASALSLEWPEPAGDWRVETSRGWALQPPAVVDDAESWTPSVRYTLDDTIFGPECVFDAQQLATRLRDLALMFPGISFTFSHEPTGQVQDIARNRGMVGALRARFALREDEVFHTHILRPQQEDLALELAVGWRRQRTAPVLHSYLNTARLPREGQAATRFRKLWIDALTDAVRDALPGIRDPYSALQRGLVGVIALDGPRLGVTRHGDERRTTLPEARAEHLSALFHDTLRDTMSGWLTNHLDLPPHR